VTARGTFTLAVTFAVLAAYLALSRAPAREPAAAAALLTQPEATISRVELGREVSVERRGSAWSVPQAEDLVAALGTLRPLAVVDDAPNDLPAYGLGADASRLRVLSGTRVLLDLELGAPNPAGTGMYVRQSGQGQVLLVGSLLRWELEKLRRAAAASPPP